MSTNAFEQNKINTIGIKPAKYDFDLIYFSEYVDDTTELTIYTNNSSVDMYIIDLMLSVTSLSSGGTTYSLYVKGLLGAIEYYIINNQYVDINVALSVLYSPNIYYKLKPGYTLRHVCSNHLKKLTISGRGVLDQ